MSTDRTDAGAGKPIVNVLQGSNGALMISYQAADPFEPGVAKPFVNVNGTMNIVPTGGGSVAVGGDITPYPSTEAYQYKPDGTVTQLFNQQVTTNQLGPLTLPFGHNHVGASLPDLPQPWTPQMPDGLPSSAPRLIPTQPLPLTTLGPAANPPQIATVELPAPPTLSVAAPPLPRPHPAAAVDSALLKKVPLTIKSISLSPQYWALATFFIPISAAITYGVWLGVSAAGLAHSTEAEYAVRTGTLFVLSVLFAFIPKPWARAVVVASVAALVLVLIGVIEYELFRAT